MQKVNATYLKKYLISNKNFVDTIKAMFSDVLRSAGLAGLRLSQVKEDGELACIVEKGRILDDEDTLIHLPVIIGHIPAMYVTACCGNVGVSVSQVINLAHITLVVQSIAVKKVSASASAPASLKGIEMPPVEDYEEQEEIFDEDETEENVASSEEESTAEENTQNSENNKGGVSWEETEELYKNIFSIIDKIPTGVAVLDNEKEEVIYMNKAAEDTIPAQNAMGMALSKYINDNEREVGEVVDEDTGLAYDVTFAPIRWVDGKDVILGAAVDMNE